MNRGKEINEYAEFLRAHEDPPAALNERILAQIHRALNPSLKLIVAKTLSFHVAGCLLTLSFCPQFGVSLTGYSGFMGLLMNYHPAVCFFACGLTWMLLGQTLTFAFLNLDEQRVLNRTRWPLMTGVVGLSVIVLACVGQVQWDSDFFIWLGGAAVIVLLFNVMAVRWLRSLGVRALRAAQKHPDGPASSTPR